MKGIHRFVNTTQSFSHPASPSSLHPPVNLSHFLFSSIILSVQFWVKKCIGVDSARSKVRGREWRREQICRTAWRPVWGHACHFSFHPSPPLAGARAHKSAYCTWASVELCWVGVGERHRPLHLFSSQAICSVSPGLPVGRHVIHACTQLVGHLRRSTVGSKGKW